MAAPRSLLGRLKSFQIGAYQLEDVVADFTQEKTKGGADKNIAGADRRQFSAALHRDFRFSTPANVFGAQCSVQPRHRRGYERTFHRRQRPESENFRGGGGGPGTPAAKAGIEPGDVIAGIGDEAAADLTLYAVRDLFRQVGYQYKVLIDRKGQTITVSMQMRRRI